MLNLWNLLGQLNLLWLPMLCILEHCMNKSSASQGLVLYLSKWSCLILRYIEFLKFFFLVESSSL